MGDMPRNLERTQNRLATVEQLMGSNDTNVMNHASVNVKQQPNDNSGAPSPAGVLSQMARGKMGSEASPQFMAANNGMRNGGAAQMNLRQGNEPLQEPNSTNLMSGVAGAEFEPFRNYYAQQNVNPYAMQANMASNAAMDGTSNMMYQNLPHDAAQMKMSDLEMLNSMLMDNTPVPIQGGSNFSAQLTNEGAVNNAMYPGQDNVGEHQFMKNGMVKTEPANENKNNGNGNDEFLLSLAEPNLSELEDLVNSVKNIENDLNLDLQYQMNTL